MTPLTLSWLSGMASAKRLASSETSPSETKGMVCDGKPGRKCNRGFFCTPTSNLATVSGKRRRKGVELRVHLVVEPAAWEPPREVLYCCVESRSMVLRCTTTVNVRLEFNSTGAVPGSLSACVRETFSVVSI